MNKHTKVGVFVVVIIAILIGAWIWLAQIKFRGKGQEVLVRFPDVTGLKINDPVKVWGVEKGSVKGIEFTRDYIEVKLFLEKEVRVYTDAHAKILDVAMISGTKYIAFEPGQSGIPLAPNASVPGEASLGIPLSMIGDLGAKFGAILSIVESTELINSLGSTLQNLEETTKHLSQIVKENQSDLRTTINDLRLTANKIGKTTSHADSLLLSIKRGEGTLGKLATSDSLYQELNSTLISIRELAEDIKANPRRYLKIF